LSADSEKSFSMKVTQKNLFIVSLFFALTFGFASYFAFTPLKRMAKLSTEQEALLTTLQIKAIVAESLSGKKNLHDSLESGTKSLLETLENKFEGIDDADNFVIINADSSIIFSLNGNHHDDIIRELKRCTPILDTLGIHIQRSANKNLLTIWPIHRSSSFSGIIKLKSDSNLQKILHRATMNFYVLGVSGLLGVVLISLLLGRFVKSPMKKIETAMSVLERRKYGYRIKNKQNDEFHSVYQKTNRALEKFEQIDSAQRVAVRKKNMMVKELRTISRFMNIMAHEVKNPLHALVINVDVLKTKIQREKPKTETLKHTKIIEKELEHLQEVIQGFLNFVRPGVPQKEKVKLNQTVKSVCQMVRQEAGKAKVKIETRLADNVNVIDVDKNQLQQALHNLLINAIHASPPQSKIQVRTWFQRGNSFISIKDVGAGIPKEQLSKIFDLYYTTKKNGSGIGLPITKKLIESNLGHLKLESKPEKGTTVTISFRVAR